VSHLALKGTNTTIRPLDWRYASPWIMP